MPRTKIFEIPQDLIRKNDPEGVCRAMVLSWCDCFHKYQIPGADWINAKSIRTMAGMQRNYRNSPDSSPILRRLKLQQKQAAISWSYANDFGEWTDRGINVDELPNGLYYVAITSRKNLGHAIGLNFSGEALYYLNQNEGMFRYGPRERKSVVLADAISVEREHLAKLDDPLRSISIYEITRDNARACCYITSAVCTSLGLPDSCDELNILRWYRDNWLLSQSDGKKDVEFYYNTAPSIVDAIDKSPYKERIYRKIYREMINPSIVYVKEKEYEKARKLYKEYTLSLACRYL